jgi:hypothetical protein
MCSSVGCVVLRPAKLPVTPCAVALNGEMIHFVLTRGRLPMASLAPWGTGSHLWGPGAVRARPPLDAGVAEVMRGVMVEPQAAVKWSPRGHAPWTIHDL